MIKRIAILQPGYLPWLGFFEQMALTDLFIILDDVQYTKNDWRSRNRIRTKDGWIWLTVPVYIKGKSTQLMSKAIIDNTKRWSKRHWGLIEANYRLAPYFNEYKDFFKKLYIKKWEYLINLDMHIIYFLAEELGINTPIKFSSKINKEGEKTDRLINLCKSVAADYLYDGESSKNFIEEDKFRNNNIAIEYQHYEHSVYKQQYEPFIPYMSIIDLLFNYGKESLDIILHKKKWNGSTE